MIPVRSVLRLAHFVGTTLALALTGGSAAALGDDESLTGVEARLNTPSTMLPPGKALLVDFSLRNTTDQPVVLTVPDLEPEPVATVAGLPLSHIFSGPGFSGLTVRGEFNRAWSDALGFNPPSSAPEIVIGPYGIVGTQLDVTKFYPALRTPGLYRLVWQPYGGKLTSNTLVIDVAPLKQAIILTDEGAMTVQLDYDRAPNHVANFLELARNGFYNQKTFHRIEPGYFIQGGCPNGDGTGIRPDGKRLKAEFNDHPFNRGTVCMARLESDPDSASCQFIITNTRLPDWDGRYTAFGELIGDESFQTLDKLMQAPVVDQRSGKPERTLFIRAIRIVDAPVEDATLQLPQVSGRTDGR